MDMDARNWAERIWDTCLSARLGPVHRDLLNELQGMVIDDNEGAAYVIAVLIQQQNEEIQ